MTFFFIIIYKLQLVHSVTNTNIYKIFWKIYSLFLKYKFILKRDADVIVWNEHYGVEKKYLKDHE